MNTIVIGQNISEKEKVAYINYAHSRYPGVAIDTLTINVSEDDVELTYEFAPVKFERIRRITGYLVGTLDRFNDAKRKEEADRVKHSLT